MKFIQKFIKKLLTMRKVSSIFSGRLNAEVRFAGQNCHLA